MVEDGPDNQRLISFVLKKAGAEVVIAQNGQEAVDKVLSCAAGQKSDGQAPAPPFDLILMDIQMPVMDGYEATQRLRQGGFTGPIIALTAHAMPQDIRRCAEVGCDFHLSKPIDRKVLMGTISRFLATPSSVRAKGSSDTDRTIRVPPS